MGKLALSLARPMMNYRWMGAGKVRAIITSETSFVLIGAKESNEPASAASPNHSITPGSKKSVQGTRSDCK
jgi:hypothetical protein